MKKINAFLVALVALFAVSLNAGAQSQKETVEFNPHWYFDGKVGGQYTLGDAKFMDLLSPNAQVGIGYNFNPVLGLRLSANAWQSKGGWKESVDLPHSPYKWTYVAPQLDLMFNLSNLFCGFNPNRLVDVSVFGGIAANIGLSNKQMNENYDAVGKNYYDYDMMPDPHWAVTNGEPFGTYNWTGTKVRPFGHFGVDVDFKVSDRVKVGVEGSANVGSDKYNSKGTNCADWYFNALVGVKVALGKTTKRVVEVLPEPAPAPAPAPVVKAEPKPEPAPVVKKDEPLKETFFYQIRMSDVNDDAKVAKIVEWCNEYPNKTIVVSGYADKGTGNARVNKKYAEQRAFKVADAIKAKGVSADRIMVESYGDTVQPFAENDQNRCTIVVGE